MQCASSDAAIDRDVGSGNFGHRSAGISQPLAKRRLIGLNPNNAIFPDAQCGPYGFLQAIPRQLVTEAFLRYQNGQQAGDLHYQATELAPPH